MIVYGNVRQSGASTLHCEINVNANLYSDIVGSSTTWDRSTTHPKFDPVRVRTHDFQIILCNSDACSITIQPSVTSITFNRL